jgi:hypothetical protein
VKGRKVGEFRGSDIGDIRYVLNPSLRKPRSSAKKKRTVNPGEAFEDTGLKPWFELVKF